MSWHDSSRTPSRISLQALVAVLRSRCEAISCFQGGFTYYHEELAIFRQVAEEQNLILQEVPYQITLAPSKSSSTVAEESRLPADFRRKTASGKAFYATSQSREAKPFTRPISRVRRSLLRDHLPIRSNATPTPIPSAYATRSDQQNVFPNMYFPGNVTRKA